MTNSVASPKWSGGIYCNAGDLFKMVVRAYPQPAWTVLAELRDGTGFSTKGQSCDAMAFGTWPSRGLRIVGFEFKSYRGDWLRELKRPDKAEKFSGYCDEWWLVTGSDGVAKPEEIPPSWGWAVGTAKGLKRIKEPEVRSPGPLDRLFFMSIIRNIATAYVPASKVKALADEKIEEAREELRGANKYEIERLTTEASQLHKRIKDFQEASGIEIDRWMDGKEVGRIVNLVKNGGLRWQLRTITEAATKAKEVLEAVAALELYKETEAQS